MGQARIKIPSILLYLVIGLGVATRSSQAADESLEYQVKAAFLLNFVKFVGWPASAFPQPDSPISICILGADPFGKVLDQLIEGESVNDRKLAIERVKATPIPKDCQVLFLSRVEREMYRTLPGLGPGILTVGEGDGFIREGGMISFVIENRRVRFDINRTTAENAGLKLSSKLLSVARSVVK
jgi:hypothetical protein